MGCGASRDNLPQEKREKKRHKRKEKKKKKPDTAYLKNTDTKEAVTENNERQRSVSFIAPPQEQVPSGPEEGNEVTLWQPEEVDADQTKVLKLVTEEEDVLCISQSVNTDPDITVRKATQAKELIDAFVLFIESEPLLHSEQSIADYLFERIKELPNVFQNSPTVCRVAGSVSSLQFLCDGGGKKQKKNASRLSPRTHQSGKLIPFRVATQHHLHKEGSVGSNAWETSSDASQRSMVSHVLSHIAGGKKRPEEESKVSVLEGDPLEQLLISAAEIVQNSAEGQETLSSVVASEVARVMSAESATIWWLRGSEFVAYVGAEQQTSSSLKTATVTKQLVMPLDTLAKNSPEREVYNTKSHVHYRADFDTDGFVHHEKHEMREVLYHPIKNKGVLIGLCKCCNKNRDQDIDFSEDEINLLTSLLIFTGVCLHNYTLYGELRGSVENTQSMLNLTADVSNAGFDIAKLCGCIITTAQRLLESEACRLFLVDNHTSELVTIIDEKEYRFSKHKGVEGTVFATGDSVNMADAYKHSNFNPQLDRMLGLRTKSILCVPIYCDKEIVGVAQLLNKRGSLQYTEMDQQQLVRLCEYCGKSIGNVLVHEKMMKEKRTTQSVLSTVQHLQSVDLTNIAEIANKIMENAKSLVVCEASDLWMVNKETASLQAPTAEKLPSAPFDETVAGRVVVQGTVVNVQNADEDPRVSKDPLLASCKEVRSILCLPIKNLENEVLGVSQLVNKENGAFTADDTRIMELFSSFAGMCLRTAGLIEFMKKSSSAHSKLVKLMSCVGMPKHSRAPSLFKASTSTKAHNVMIPLTSEEQTLLLKPSFPIHKYQITLPEHSRLVSLCGELFSSFGIPQEFNISIDVICNFVASVQGKYRQIPYHNFTHAFDVTQTVCTYLDSLPDGKYITRLDRFALIVTALCHDIDHMGLNNSFQLKAETPLGVLSSISGSKSVLEVHHCNLTIEILSAPETNILAGLEHKDAKDAWRTVIDCILGTDMARHQEICSSFSEMMTEYDVESSSSRRLFMTMLLKAADISNVTKPFEISKLWAHRITDEFNWQGDSEKAAGIQVTHQYQDLKTVQLGFINAMALPMYTMLATGIPELEFILEELKKNIGLWQEHD